MEVSNSENIKNNNDHNSCKTNCKLSCKCIIAITIIFLLTLVSLYLYIQHTKQNDIINSQQKYIDEIKSSALNSDRISNDIFSPLFDDFFTFKRNSALFDIDNFFNIKDRRLSDVQTTNLYHYAHVTTKVYDNEYIVTTIVAGLDKEQISINLTDDLLVISTNKQSLVNDKKEPDPNVKLTNTDSNIEGAKIDNHLPQYHYSFKVPNDVDKDKITSDLKNGILTITMPRDTSIKESKKINIK